MRVLALDAALARCSAAVVINQNVVAVRQTEATRGHAALLPVMVQDVLAEVDQKATELDLVAVTVGPGSFTGIRAGLALAHGIALAAAVPLIGVTVGEVLADSLPRLGEWSLWTAIDSRRGRVFLERQGSIAAFALDALPHTDGKVAVAGDASVSVAARLAARDMQVMLTDARLPLPRHVAVVGEQRFRGDVRPLPAQPLYIDPPEARLPAGGLRPPPAG